VAFFEETDMTFTDDPHWFNKHPRRRHRVRPVSFAEIMEGVLLDAPEGCTELAAVRRVAPLELMTVYLVDCAATNYASLSEADAYEYFEQALPTAPRELEALLRADAERD
jgi:hypothetical protein